MNTTGGNTVGGAGVDQFGVAKIFPDAAGPKFYHFQIGQWGSDSGDRDHFNGRTYGSCEDSDRNNPRKSVVSTEWETRDTQYINQEITGYFYLSEMDNGNKVDCYKYEQFGKGSSVSIKLRGSHHSNNDEDSAKCYIFDFQFEGGNRNNFQKEYPHGDYYKMTIAPRLNLLSNLDKWVGYKAATFNQGNGVHCLAFVDYGSRNRTKEEGPDLASQNWKLYYEVFDDGRLDERFEITHEEEYREDEVVRSAWRSHHGEQVTQFRIDRIIRPEAKFLSVREVSPETIEGILVNF
jgi:hypothetical protein